MLRFLAGLTWTVLAVACTHRPHPATSAGTPGMDRIAESYVRLALAVGEHDPDYVDAYYGPAAWREEARQNRLSLGEILVRAQSKRRELGNLHPAKDDELVLLRHRFLDRQLAALVARVAMLEGKKLGFDEESRALYDAEAPLFDRTSLEKTLARLGELLPGEGDLAERFWQLREKFIVPPRHLEKVFARALKACRARTLAHIQLPKGEKFEVEYVQGEPWGAYNWYKGNFRSLIQINTSLPVAIDRVIGTACHEGYPGHHVYNVLLEKHLVQDRGWIEFSVYPLFSPLSLIAEGTANFGVELAFPAGERLAWETAHLYPLAGLDPAGAGKFQEVRKLMRELSAAGIQAARAYLDGRQDAKDTLDWLVRFTLVPRKRAEQKLRFFEKYRSYVVNYRLGQDLVRAYVTSRAGQQTDLKWKEFERLLKSPRLPSDLH